jgi:hypothetical protein
MFILRVNYVLPIILSLDRKGLATYTLMNKSIAVFTVFSFFATWYSPRNSGYKQ